MPDRGFPQAEFPIGDGNGGDTEDFTGFLLSQSQLKAFFSNVLPK